MTTIPHVTRDMREIWTTTADDAARTFRHPDGGRCGAAGHVLDLTHVRVVGALKVAGGQVGVVNRGDDVGRDVERRVAVPAGTGIQTVGAAALRARPKVGVGVGAPEGWSHG